tara:strand:- start:1172 stop:2014 length:843 start_codon:yes stop_codon:yes gene_type:complete
MKLKSAVFLNALNAAFTQLKTKMTPVQIAKMKMKAEQGMFAIFSEFGNAVNAADGVGGADGALLHFFKTLTDSTALAEDAVLAFNKGLSETINITDPHVVSYGKPLGDAAAVAELISKSFPKSFADSFSVAEDAAILGLSKPFSETPGVTDVLRPSANKGLSETPSFVDAITARALTKALANSVDATDDVDGEASILDDQEMQFVKNTTNVATVSEVIAIATTFNRAFGDSFGVTDGDVLNFGKRPSNTASMTDAGSLRSQGYCDFTYFQEDYVGASRTF